MNDTPDQEKKSILWNGSRDWTELSTAVLISIAREEVCGWMLHGALINSTDKSQHAAECHCPVAGMISRAPDYVWRTRCRLTGV